jgi:hypothetical protein
MRLYQYISSAKSTGNIVFSQPVQRIGKNSVRGSDFNEVSQVGIRGSPGNAGGFLHIITGIINKKGNA